MILGYPFIGKKLWVKSELVRLGFPIDVAAKNAEFSKRNVVLRSKKRNYRLNGNPFYNPSTVCGMFPPMGLANVSMVAPFFGRYLRFLRESQRIMKKLEK